MNQGIADLVAYGLNTGLIAPENVVYLRNQLLDALRIAAYEAPEKAGNRPLEDILASLLDDAYARGIIPDSIAQRDLLDAKLMGVITPPPSEIIRKFWDLYAHSRESATDWYYRFSQDSDYIRRYRIKKDQRWTTQTEYGELDITINLSKPEKDPRDIAAAQNAPQSGYPACLLCRESEGYAGHANFPARQNHRLIPIRLSGEPWFFQYSPYVYYNEHCIALSARHRPMKIDRGAFARMFDFVDIFPHYFIGSNADLPIVGGSILSHDHFQGGRYVFAMERAATEKTYAFPDYPHVQIGRLRWPMSVLRLQSASRNDVIALAERILHHWREYSDEGAGVFSHTEGVPHNTITPIARRKQHAYELDLVLRNNITTEEHPLGVFHPHARLHHIKKENIGLIEVMGLAVLPARLKDELALLQEALCNGRNIAEEEAIAKHADWAAEIRKTHPHINVGNAEAILREAVGLVFAQVLTDAGVFKRDAAGTAAFDRFAASCGGK